MLGTSSVLTAFIDDRLYDVNSASRARQNVAESKMALIQPFASVWRPKRFAAHGVIQSESHSQNILGSGVATWYLLYRSAFRTKAVQRKSKRQIFATQCPST